MGTESGRLIALGPPTRWYPWWLVRRNGLRKQLHNQATNSHGSARKNQRDGARDAGNTEHLPAEFAAQDAVLTD